MAQVFISLGSNLGSRIYNCRLAVKLFSKKKATITTLSPWFLTEPLGIPQPWFINAVAQVTTTLSPMALLDTLQQVEKALGRREKCTGGPRIIDLDILLYDRLILNTERLTLPHPKFRERRFVLLPLATLAPELQEPVTGTSIQELLKNCQDPSRVIPLVKGEPFQESGLQYTPRSPEILPRAFWCHR